MSNGDPGRLQRLGNDFRVRGLIFPWLLRIRRALAVGAGGGPATAGDPSHGLVEVGGVRVQVLLGRGVVRVAEERLDISQRGAC